MDSGGRVGGGVVHASVHLEDGSDNKLGISETTSHRGYRVRDSFLCLYEVVLEDAAAAGLAGSFSRFARYVARRDQNHLEGPAEQPQRRSDSGDLGDQAGLLIAVLHYAHNNFR